MQTDPEIWIQSLPGALALHSTVLKALLDEARRDERVRVLVVGCSIGRGVADEFSDIDAYLAVAPEQWSGYLDDLAAVAGRLGSFTDLTHKRIAPSGGDPYQSAWVLYDSGVQLDLVVAQARSEIRPRRDWVVLHDPDGRVREVQPDRYATTDEVREWAYDAWSTLLLCTKYLKRGSLWEAVETLHLVRTRIWRIWAAARGIADPQYGVTAVLDSADPSPPPGIEETQAPLERAALAQGCLACADLLSALWPEAVAATGGSDLVLPKAAHVVRQTLTDLVGSPAWTQHEEVSRVRADQSGSRARR